LRFVVGSGEVIRGLDMGVTTMRLGELARFRISLQFAGSGACALEGAALHGGTVLYEVELLDWVTCCDIFGDGMVVKRVLERPVDKRRPIMGQECLLRYKLILADSGVALKDMDALEHTVGAPLPAVGRGLVCARLLDAAIVSMRRGERALLQCTAEVAFGELAPWPEGVSPDDRIACELELQEFLETTDVSFEKDGTVMKRSLRARDAWTKCRDGGTCTLRVLSVKVGDAVLVEDRTLEFVLGNGEVCDALECAVASMRLLEVAVVSCSLAELCGEPKLGVAGQVGLAFRMAVVGYEEGPGERARGDAEKLEFLKGRKDMGTALFKAGRYRLAAHSFRKVHELLGYIDDYRGVRGGEARAARVAELKKACMLNRALCLLRVGASRAALSACDLVLEEETQNPKALFRRAQAHLALEDCQLALRDARAALHVEPRNFEIQQLVAKIQARLKEEAEGTGPMYMRMCSALGTLPHPLDVD